MERMWYFGLRFTNDFVGSVRFVYEEEFPDW